MTPDLATLAPQAAADLREERERLERKRAFASACEDRVQRRLDWWGAERRELQRQIDRLDERLLARRKGERP